jgi:undecaprenyl diphosphate synthase
MCAENIPEVLALIPDGNRRWAKKHSLSFFDGYNLGVRKFIDFAGWCIDYGVSNIVVWAFSTENFKRPKREQDVLFDIYKKAANDKYVLAKLHSSEASFRVVGNRGMLPRDVANALGRLESETSRYKRNVVNMMVAYGGKDDLLHATAGLVKGAVEKRVDSITDAIFRSYLLSSSVPDIDFVIRTSGEERLSGFMPVQTAYAELYFAEKLWPDFTRKDLDLAMEEYARRRRRFGT